MYVYGGQLFCRYSKRKRVRIINDILSRFQRSNFFNKPVRKLVIISVSNLQLQGIQLREKKSLIHKKKYKKHKMNVI